MTKKATPTLSPPLPLPRSASGAGPATDAAVSAHYWHAYHPALLQGALVRQCHHRGQAQVAERAKPDEQVRYIVRRAFNSYLVCLFVCLFRPYFDLCDGIFLNYNWTESGLSASRLLAKERRGEVYVGIDVFGRGCPGGGGFNSCQVIHYRMLQPGSSKVRVQRVEFKGQKDGGVATAILCSHRL